MLTTCSILQAQGKYQCEYSYVRPTAGSAIRAEVERPSRRSLSFSARSLPVALATSRLFLLDASSSAAVSRIVASWPRSS